jgi:hypothetical protein
VSGVSRRNFGRTELERESVFLGEDRSKTCGLEDFKNGGINYIFYYEAKAKRSTELNLLKLILR